MIKSNKVVAILPLRSGSKRIKDKNIRTVGYYPLFVHIIETCLSIPEVNKIIVSTDSSKYASLVKKYFKDKRVVISLRPSILAQDDTKTECVIKQVITEFKLASQYIYALLVQATNPLTSSHDISAGIRKINNEKLNSVFSVAESRRFYLRDEDQLINRPMTQEKIPELYETGCFWLFKIDKFLTEENRIIKPFGYIKVDEKNTLDIDNTDEIYLADLILAKKVRINEDRYFTKRETTSNTREYYNPKVDPDGNVRNILYEKKQRIEFAKSEINFINQYAQLKDRNLKLLSVGVGGGYAESKISKKYWKVGIEPDKEAAIIAKDYLDEIHNDFFENIEFQDYSFDVVFAHHVIEHLKNPITFIQKAKKILKLGGKLIIGTPNFDSAAARRYGENFRLLHDPTHISLFNDVGLRMLLEDFGFSIDFIDYPYFDTNFFNKDEILKIFDKEIISPPFYGSIMTFYATKN